MTDGKIGAEFDHIEMIAAELIRALYSLGRPSGAVNCERGTVEGSLLLIMSDAHFSLAQVCERPAIVAGNSFNDGICPVHNRGPRMKPGYGD